MDESNIILNIFSTNRGSDSNNNSSKTVVSGKRKLKDNHSDTYPEKKCKDSFVKVIDDQSKRKPKRIKSEVTKVEKSQKFSSLFRNNPEIPQVDDCNVKSVKEVVFSTKNFSNLGIHTHLVKCLAKRLNASTLTNVQRESIPQIMQGKDVLVKSQTGSGKTLCYAVPIVEKLQSMQPQINRLDGPYAMVISPTRELTLQSFETIEKLTQSFVWVVPGLIMGGEKKSKEKARLRKGINIVLGTPGRILDHLYNTKSLSLEKIKWLVIDEADRMLDMGFENEISQIISVLKLRCPTHMQTILLSATLSAGIEKLAGMSLDNPVRIDIADNDKVNSKSDKKSVKSKEPQSDDANTVQELCYTTPDGLKHHYVIVPSKLRLVTLAAFILWKAKYSSKNKKLIVFLTTQFSVDFHYKVLSQILGVNEKNENTDCVDLFSLHGDMAQKDRTRVYHQFTKADSGVLLCTDVAARGLNLQKVRWIIQYNTPGKPTDYIHRVGRTARIGNQGHALIFLTPSEVEYLKVLQNMNISLHEIKVDDVLKTLLVDADKWATYEKFKPNTAQECATAVQVGIETFIYGSKDMRTLARKAYQSFIRAYSTYPKSMKYIFHVKHLHLGHVAKSFGLQEAPKHIASVVSTNIRHTNKRPHPPDKKRHSGNVYEKSPQKKPRLDLISEFSSGLEDENVLRNRRKSTSNDQHTLQSKQKKKQQQKTQKKSVKRKKQ